MRIISSSNSFSALHIYNANTLPSIHHTTCQKITSHNNLLPSSSLYVLQTHIAVPRVCCIRCPDIFQGFRMTVGSPTSTATDAKKHIGLSYNCLTTLLNRGPEMRDFPTKPCPAGIFVTHHFPALVFPILSPIQAFVTNLAFRCWDGKNLDSPDHQSHMYNTITQDGFLNAGACPSSHPVRTPQVVYETVWDTTKFSSLWTASQGNPFVWSFEGTSGYGTHADYMFGWKGDALERAMNKSECFYDGCGSITKQDMSVANKCTVKDMVGEPIDGCKCYRSAFGCCGQIANML